MVLRLEASSEGNLPPLLLFMRNELDIGASLVGILPSEIGAGR